jgi:phospholipase/lecithinase/hemolysin
MKLLCILSLLLLASVEPAISSTVCFDKIFSFGDTFTDTGNGRFVYAENKVPDPTAHLPYGQTYFHNATGRSTDGRLIIDFIAQKLGLSLLTPSLSKDGNFSQGANFAVSAATALDVSFFKDTPIAAMLALDTSLTVQLQWFQSLKPSLCSPAKACPSGFFDKSLFFMGEFGVNDYSFSVLGKPLTEVYTIVPNVTRTIAEATEGLLNHGAKTVIVPGIPPLGCTPPNLYFFASSDPASYEDDTECLKGFNELAKHHNTLLQAALQTIQTNHPSALVVYADFFTPVMNMVKSPWKYGFTSDILSCCCGGGGEYNFNMSAGCGMPGATVCDDPSQYLFWDGHFTEAAHDVIAKYWLKTLNLDNHMIEAAYRYLNIA